jgi:hypothetical protein
MESSWHHEKTSIPYKGPWENRQSKYVRSV